MAKAQLSRCMEEDCVWIGDNPEKLWHPDGMHWNTICPVCGEFAEPVDEDAPASQQAKAGLN
jgi:hypothetical protein